MRIDVWSDVVCPWCYIGKVRFDRALERLEADGLLESGVEIVYRAYQLDPTAPTGTPQPVRDVYARKFGGPERAEAIFDHLGGIATQDGLQFDFDRALRANTTSAHRLLWWARTHFGMSGQSSLKTALMAAYFTHGRDLGDIDTLIDIATVTFEDAKDLPSEVNAFLHSDQGRNEVVEDMAEATARGITGVPTYVIDGQWAVPGAQDTETFERVLRRTLERRSEVADA